MSRPLVGYRNGCALHGALAAASAIEGVTPLVHSTPGCALRGAFANTEPAGWSGAPIHLPPIASTNLAEKHIVFGGASRLRERIKNTLRARSGAPVVVADGVPVGVDAVADLLRRLADATGLIDEAAIERLLVAERRFEDFALDETLDALSRVGRRHAAIVGGSLLAGPLARFLISTLGWEVKTVVLTDEPPVEAARLLPGLLPGAVGRILSSADGAEAAAAIRAARPDFLVAPARHDALATELGIPFLSIAEGGRASLSGGFTGTRGSARLLAAIVATQAASKSR